MSTGTGERQTTPELPADDPAVLVDAAQEEVAEGGLDETQSGQQIVSTPPTWLLPKPLHLLLAARRYRHAEAWFRSASKAQPGSPAVLLGLARVQLVYGDAPGASTLLGRALARASGASDLHAARAEAYLLLGKIERARTRAASALGSRLASSTRRAYSHGAALREICRVADAGALRAARLMERSLSAPGAARAFLRAHLAALEGREDTLALARAAAGLHPARLLPAGAAVPPTVLTVRGHVEKGVPVELKQYLPFLDPARLW